VQSIPTVEPQPTPQKLLGPYPLVQLHHWFRMVEAPLDRMKTLMASCRGPSPVAEAMRQRYLQALQACEAILRDVALSPDMQEQLAHETAQLNRDCERQRTHRVGVRRRKAAAAQMAAD